MSEQHWNEFLDKLDFAQLTERWGSLPLHWLGDTPPANLSEEETALFLGLKALPKELEGEEKESRVHELVRTFRASRSARALSLDQTLTPPGSRVVLRYLDPDDLGQGDCLITVGSWDRLGHWVAQRAGWGDEAPESTENPVRKEPGELNFRNVVVFPDRGTPAPRAFRSLCEKTLRQARGLGARRITITHLHLPQPGLPDRFAAAELVSAVRGMLRDGGGGLSVEILALTSSVYGDYKHWFESLAALARGEQAAPPPPQQEASPETGEAGEPLANSLWDFAQRTSALAQEAGRGMTEWFRVATAPSSQATEAAPVAPATAPERPTVTTLELEYEEQQALNLFYLGQREAAQTFQSRWTQSDSLVGLYLAALNKTLQVLGERESARPTEPAPSKKKGRAKKKAEAESVAEETIESPAEQPASPDTELDELKASLLSTADSLGSSNGLSRYFQLLAWRVDLWRPDLDSDVFEEEHARLLRAAWAWEDFPLQSFLRSAGQEADRVGIKAYRPSYVPVYPQGSRSAPTVD